MLFKDDRQLFIFSILLKSFDYLDIFLNVHQDILHEPDILAARRTYLVTFSKIFSNSLHNLKSQFLQVLVASLDLNASGPIIFLG